VLASSKMSRLYRSLVYERRIAVDVTAYQSSRELGSFGLVAVTAAPGRSLTELMSGVDAEIVRLAEDGPSEDEMERIAAQAESQFVYRLQTIGGFGGKSDQVNAYNVLCGDPGYFQADLARYRSCSAAVVRAAVARLLPLDRRIVLSVVPRGSRGLALPDSEMAIVA
jgi:zinc protease